VVYPAFPYDAKGLLMHLLMTESSAFFEHKQLYRSVYQDAKDYYTYQ
jgi:pyruvate/2-oxoglutarate/acetoin dehydrogenase E1 component